MRTGKLRHRLRVQQRVETPDGAGGVSYEWTDVVRVWGDVQTTTGRELQAAKQTVPTLTHQVVIRYRSDLTAAMRVVTDDGHVLDIAALQDPDGRRRQLTVLCEEKVAPLTPVRGIAAFTLPSLAFAALGVIDFRYVPGNDLSNATFARASTAQYLASVSP